MASVLTSFFSRDPKAQFPYELPTTPLTSLDGVSIAHSFKKAEPDEKATVFWTMSSDFAGGSLKQQAHKLKTMRHPGIITYFESIEIDGKFYLVTEPCVPLSNYFLDNSLSPDQKEFIVSWGLYQVLNTLKFLHSANVSHEAIRRAIFVTPAGDWKLAHLCSTTTYDSPKSDLNQLALVVWEVFNGFKESMTRPEAPGKIPKRLHELYRKMGGPQAERVTADELIKGLPFSPTMMASESRATGGFFKNRFVDTLLFLEEFQLKEAHEKQVFFTHLRDHLSIFPDDVAKFKILPKLILSYEYGDAGPNILIPLFKLGHLLDEQEYQRRIVPCLVKLFSNLVSGFTDISPAVRESTVKAMVPLAEKLNVHNLNTELMKHLARLQGTDEHGGIRTNTTICLGKIGCYLEPSNRQKILIGAFTRGMKDPFPMARMAAVLALSATQQFYSLIEIANRVLPALSPLTCDPEKQVRDQAFRAIKGFLETLEKASDNPELIPELEAQVKAGGKGIFGSDKVPQWASWALKSLSGKFYKGAPPTDTQHLQTDPKTTPLPEVKPVSISKAEPSKPSPPSDGWGEIDDDDFEDCVDVKSSEPQTKKRDADDWGSSWEKEMTAKPKPVLKPTMPLQAKPKVSVGGSLKLGSNLPSKPKEPVNDDDIDFLLGVTTKPKPSQSRTQPAKPGGGGWDDFDASGESFGSGWDESSSHPTPAPVSAASSTSSSTAAKDREARRAEMAARNEARRKELAEKKAQKAKALPAVLKPTPAPKAPSSSNDGWDDF